MSGLKLVVWNMEWMNDLYGPNNLPAAFKADDEIPYHAQGCTVRQRRDDLSGVLNELAPDIVVCVEGPNRASELQLFYDKDVEGDWVVQTQYSKGRSQIIGIAVRIDQGKFDHPPFRYIDTNNLQAFDPFLVDTDDDELEERFKFERRPLYVEIRPQNGSNFRILGLHLKSKGIFKAYEWSKWWQIADANRRKILAQATQVRLQFLDPFLTDPQTRNVPLIVCGDINDGPGLDASEKRLFGSGIERLMGSVWKPELCLGNALFDTLSDKAQIALDFSSIHTTSFKDPIFNNAWHRVWIDHILYSKNREDGWVSDAQVQRIMKDDLPMWKKYPHASDHFPLSAILSV